MERNPKGFLSDWPHCGHWTQKSCATIPYRQLWILSTPPTKINWFRKLLGPPPSTATEVINIMNLAVDESVAKHECHWSYQKLAVLVFTLYTWMISTDLTFYLCHKTCYSWRGVETCYERVDCDLGLDHVTSTCETWNVICVTSAGPTSETWTSQHALNVSLVILTNCVSSLPLYSSLCLLSPWKEPSKFICKKMRFFGNLSSLIIIKFKWVFKSFILPLNI